MEDVIIPCEIDKCIIMTDEREHTISSQSVS